MLCPHCNSCLHLSNDKEYKNFLMHRSVNFTLQIFPLHFNHIVVSALMKNTCMFDWYVAAEKKRLACSGFHRDRRKENRHSGAVVDRPLCDREVAG